MNALLMVAALLQVSAGDSTALKRSLAAPVVPGLRWGDISDVRPALERVYGDRGWSLSWSSGGRITEPARRLMAVLDSSLMRGLDPTDYDVATLRQRAQSLAATSGDAHADFDIMLSVAAVRYAHAVAHGRVDPRMLHPLLDQPDTLDTAALLRDLVVSQRPDTILANLEPRHATYQRLIALLREYRGAVPTSASSADTIAARIHQLTLALERWRWLPHSATAPWVLVNVPAFRLYALTSDREERGDMLQMNVVTGQAMEHPTPLLVTKIVAVQFHPPWLVPPSIAARELRPQALRDSTWLARGHYQLLRGSAIIPSTRANVLRMGADVTVRQLPGPWNALGRVKFVTPNGADVYLHDTPSRADFARTPRDFSHGCIRVEEPVLLAEFALQSQPGWSIDRIANALADTSTLTVPLRQSIPVYVLYQTLVPSDSGGVITYPDVYGHDRRLTRLLAGGYPYRIVATP